MIIEANESNIENICNLANMLWPHHSVSELKTEYKNLIKSDNNIVLLAMESQSFVGFCQVQLRYDYVEGTCTSPVAYLEGIYVKPEYRNRGIASDLIKQSELWAKTKNITEFASDCEYCNSQSESLHLKLGFAETNIIRCFVKKI